MTEFAIFCTKVSRNHTIEIDAKEVIKKVKEEAKEEKDIEFVLRLHGMGINPPELSHLWGFSLERVLKIIEKSKE